MTRVQTYHTSSLSRVGFANRFCLFKAALREEISMRTLIITKKMKTEKTERMKSCSEMRIERTPSIEFEPLTLTLEQIQFAREAALCVLSTRTIEEAVEIFTEGMQPVFDVKKEMDMMDLEYDDGESDNVPVLIRDLRDTVTAPF